MNDSSASTTPMEPKLIRSANRAAFSAAHPLTAGSTGRPTVDALPTHEYLVDVNTPASQVHIVLRNQPALPGVIIIGPEGIAGVISRRRFFEILGQRYGVAVYEKRPIQVMVTANRADPLIVPANSPIPEAVRLALARPSDFVYEPLLLDCGSKDNYRLLDIYTLLLAQSEILQGLQQDLTAINQELEQRVARRTAQLEEVNDSLQQEVAVRHKAEATLQVRLRYETALTQCANALLTNQSSDEVLPETLSLLLEAVGVSSVFLGIRNDDNDIVLTHQVLAENLAASQESPQTVFNYATFQYWLDFLWSGQWVVGYRDRAKGVDKALYEQLGIASLLLLPIGMGDDWHGVIGFSDVDDSRQWVDDEVDLLQTVARMVFAFSERQRYQISLSKARDRALEASKFKTDLLARVSHELRTPLSSILGYAQFLHHGRFGDLNPEQTETIGLVIGSTNYLASLVNGLLDQAQLDIGTMKLQHIPFNVRRLIAEVEMGTRVFADSKRLAFEVSVGDEMPKRLMGDRTRLQQIMTNLISNAIKFTEKGYVSMTVDKFDQTHWLILVADSGPGISKIDQERIFEAFTQVDGSPTRQHGGAGLGLSITKQLVEVMGGRIVLDSRPNMGSVFYIYLPLIIAEKESELDDV